MALNATKVLFVIVATVAITSSYHYHGIRRAKRIVKRSADPCDPTAVFRRFDGTCNNLDNPKWGSTGETLRRLIENAYEDGVSAPRSTSKSGNPLPTARSVSLAYHGPSTNRDAVTLMVMQWGQFLDHDITITPFENPNVNCSCDSTDPECLNIPLDPSDEFFGGSGRTCFSFHRSLREIVTGSGGVSVEEQFNEITAYIDASNVYGSSVEESEVLRGLHGLLLDMDHNGDSLLPESTMADCRLDTGEWCFKAGDIRVNEQPALATMHTIWMREHNRIATKLHALNHFWDDERVYQETRKIVGAMMQVITYNEFLPILLGPETMKAVGLDKKYKYKPSVDASIANSFASAAYRCGHSLIPESITVHNEVLMFGDLFLDPTTVFDSLDGVAESIVNERAMSLDRKFSHSVTRHLFEEPDEEKSGFDLVSLNIQRGRDHGLPSFNDFRKLCGLPRYSCLEQLFPDVDEIDGVYDDIDDVDLFTGGIAETPVAGGLVGPTFACIIARQYRELRRGDRFFYENRVGPQAFTAAQLKQLRKTTLSKVICRNTENNIVQKNVFLPPNNQCNPLMACKDIDNVNLSAWQETY